jgi:hypothetical protein
MPQSMVSRPTAVYRIQISPSPITNANSPAEPAATLFKISEATLERWNFSWYEDLFAQGAYSPSVVRVTSRAYRRVAPYEPGEYVATLTYVVLQRNQNCGQLGCTPTPAAKNGQECYSLHW